MARREAEHEDEPQDNNRPKHGLVKPWTDSPKINQDDAQAVEGVETNRSNQSNFDQCLNALPEGDSKLNFSVPNLTGPVEEQRFRHGTSYEGSVQYNDTDFRYNVTSWQRTLIAVRNVVIFGLSHR